MIDNSANGSWGANIVQEAWVQTLVLNTGFGGVTITVDVTFHSFTIDIGIANQSWWTNTSCSVILSFTNGVNCTWIVQKARIDTFVVMADLISSTIGVNFTFQFLTFHFRISGVASGTIAERFVVDD